MSQPRDTERENIAAAHAAGRELVDTALQRNPVLGVAALLLGPLVGLFRRRKAAPPADVRKMKLESFSYSPVRRDAAPAEHKGNVKAPYRHSGPSAGRARRALGDDSGRKGGAFHG